MMTGNEIRRIQRLLFAAAVIAIVVFVLFGEEIAAWLSAQWDAAAGSTLDEILR